MQLHQLKPIHKQRAQKIIGRGGRRGHYCGSGVPKGRSRAANILPVVRGLLKRYPKLRGYKFKTLSQKPAVLDLGILDKKFDVGQIVSPQILIEKRLVRRIGGVVPQIKILGGGVITKALVFESLLISEGAKEKIVKAGGKIK